jgi:hypothetical protein
MAICGFIDTKTEETPVAYAVTPLIHIFSEKNDEINLCYLNLINNYVYSLKSYYTEYKIFKLNLK